jgi:HD-like signal output (HDOD) protein
MKHGVPISILKEFNPLQTLSPQELKLLARGAVLQRLEANQCLFKNGSSDSRAYYLVSGRISLQATDGRSLCIDGGTEAARNPVSNLCPRKYTVTALVATEVLSIDRTALQNVLQRKNSRHVYDMREIDGAGVDERYNQLHLMILDEMLTDSCELLVLPVSAQRIHKKLAQRNLDAAELTRTVHTDPVVSAALMRAAGSALYHEAGPVRSCREAVARLGVDAAVDVARAAVNRHRFGYLDGELPFEHEVEIALVRCQRVAAISNVLAHLTAGVDPEQAWTAGLLHDIGTFAVLSYAARHHDQFMDRAELEHAVSSLRGELSVNLLQQWGCDERLITVARIGDDWYRRHDGRADYGDLVIVARLLCYLRQPETLLYPNLYEIPAYSKIAAGKLDPSLTPAILALADEELMSLGPPIAA